MRSMSAIGNAARSADIRSFRKAGELVDGHAPSSELPECSLVDGGRCRASQLTRRRGGVADPGIRRFRRYLPGERGRSPRLHLLLEVVREPEERRLGEEAAVHPQAAGSSLGADSRRDRDVRIAGDGGRCRREAEARGDNRREVVALQRGVDAFGRARAGCTTHALLRTQGHRARWFLRPSRTAPGRSTSSRVRNALG